jgi:hypothetical protein
MTGRGGPEPRVPRTTARIVAELTHLETVMREENIIVPTKVRAAIAHIRVWCRDVGKQHRH